MRRFIPFLKAGPVVAVVRMQGMIAAGGTGRLNDQTLAPVLEKAFRRKPDAVALQINSPGGSPVQSSLIGARIRRLSEERNIPVHAFIEDLAASGGYWLAAAADDVWADAGSIIGSIGVVSAGFGFDKFISRHGVDRRLYTAGESKAILDPFLPEKPEDVQRLRRLQDRVHQNFIDHVKARRGDRLADGADIFTGEIWTGQGAQEVGLIDGVGHLVPKMKEVYGDKVRFAVYRPRTSIFARLGTGFTGEAVSAVEERAGFARYGL